MRRVQAAALIYVSLICAAALGAGLFAPHPYAEQFRDHIAEPPSTSFLLGTDDLGRDRLSRLLVGLQISLLVAPCTALLAIAAGACLGAVATTAVKPLEHLILAASDLFLSLPLLLVILTLRAILPLGTGAAGSVLALGAVLVLSGWPAVARVTRGALQELRNSDFIRYARAYGATPLRIAAVHFTPQLRPILLAHFWTLMPVFLIAEANLGILGIGVSEPLPTLGNLLAELRDLGKISEQPWVLAPAGILITFLLSLHLLFSGGKER